MLLTDDGRFAAHAEALTDGGGMALLGISLRHDRSWTYIVINYTGRVDAMATSNTAAEAEALALGDLRRKGADIRRAGGPHGRRGSTAASSSVLHYGETLSVRVKRMNDEEGGSWLQLRAYLDTSAGFVHPVLTDTGQLVCVVSGRTDQDAWLRVQGELNRQGVEFSSSVAGCSLRSAPDQGAERGGDRETRRSSSLSL